MVKLNFSVTGFMYQSGLATLRDGFTAAAAGIQNQIQDETEAWQASSGEYAAEPEFADDGSTLFDPALIYDHRIEVLQEAYAELRKAFAIAVYHYWERKIRVFCKLPEGKHDALELRAERLGIRLPSEFTRVHRLANVLKHNNRGSMKALHRVWPEISGILFQVDGNRDWYANIELSDDHVYYLFDLTSQAGPTATGSIVEIEVPTSTPPSSPATLPQ